MEYTDIVKERNKTLYTTIPKRLAQRENIKKGDNVRNNLEKLGGKKDD